MSLSSILKSVNPGDERLIEIKMPIVNHEKDETISPEIIASRLLEEAKRESERVHQQLEHERETTRTELQVEREHWNQERESERVRAKEEGFQEGFAKGTEEAEKAWANTLDEARNIVTQLEHDYKRRMGQSEDDILNLSIAIAGRIVSGVLEKEPSAWVHLVKKAIKEVQDQETIKIMVTPSHMTLLLEGKEELESICRGALLQIYPDEQMGQYDCLIETPYGRIDASVDQQLRMIKLKLEEMMEAGADESKGTD